jgi:hypothetical protein
MPAGAPAGRQVDEGPGTFARCFRITPASGRSGCSSGLGLQSHVLLSRLLRLCSVASKTLLHSGGPVRQWKAPTSHATTMRDEANDSGDAIQISR